MTLPLVSVVIPTYNYGEFLGETIRSVLAQSLDEFEVIVVDDGSNDDTAAIVASFQDEGIRYIYQENQGLPAARNTGIRATNAPLIALLDADDLYHPEKLAIAIAYLDSHPEVGLLYNGRTTITTEGEPILMHRAPQAVTLTDLVLGYPFAPSDVVVRREWAEKVDLFDERRVPNGEDLDFHLRLYLKGCQFAGLPQSLNRRRMHAGRNFKAIDRKLATHLWALNTAFDNPDCPPEIADLRLLAYSKQYLVHAYWALTQRETELGLDYLANAVSADHKLESTDILSKQLLYMSFAGGGDHREPLETIVSQLPASHTELAKRLTRWAVPQGILIRTLLDALWGRKLSDSDQLRQTGHESSRLDPIYAGLTLDQLVLMLLNCGESALEAAYERLYPSLIIALDRRELIHFRAALDYHLALGRFYSEEYKTALASLWSAARLDPGFMFNRGVWSVSARSIAGLLSR